MTERSTTTSLSTEVVGARLAGSLWVPPHPSALVLMYPGSGGSDRHNDVLFPPIREALLSDGVAVCSFDKRGVGESTGRWEDADITDQADDLLAALESARAVLPNVPTGLFGHSQGGWVVLEAAHDAGADFVITNSGPAVSPSEQETYSTRRTLEGLGWDAASVEAGVADYRVVLDLLALSFGEGWPIAASLPLFEELRSAGAFLPADARLWSFAGRVMSYDPAPSLSAVNAPLLAMYGSADDVVPVELSASVLRACVRPPLLELCVLDGGDHRLQIGSEFVTGYLQPLTSFVRSATADGRSGRLTSTGGASSSPSQKLHLCAEPAHSYAAN